MMKNMTTDGSLQQFGFTFNKGGVHIARTMLFDEISILLAADINDFEIYRNMVVTDNVLGKRSHRNRMLTWRYLTSLYGFDSKLVLFRALRYFWRRDLVGRPLLALLCAYARDAILRSSSEFILNHDEGFSVTRYALEDYIESLEPGRFSAATLKSVAQNIAGTWTKSGHLVGHVNKRRKKVTATEGSVALALLEGYLRGVRGSRVFSTEYFRLLDCPPSRGMELAGLASQKGWLVFKRIGQVMEVSFPNFLTSREMEVLNEQG